MTGSRRRAVTSSPVCPESWPTSSPSSARWGSGAATLIETLFPPIPSEVILPFAGYLAQQGRLNLVGVIVAATLGGLLGALLLYGFAALVGQERASALGSP